VKKASSLTFQGIAFIIKGRFGHPSGLFFSDDREIYLRESIASGAKGLHGANGKGRGHHAIAIVIMAPTILSKFPNPIPINERQGPEMGLTGLTEDDGSKG